MKGFKGLAWILPVFAVLFLGPLTANASSFKENTWILDSTTNQIEESGVSLVNTTAVNLDRLRGLGEVDGNRWNLAAEPRELGTYSSGQQVPDGSIIVSYFISFDNDDPCDGICAEELAFDLSPLKEKWQEAYQQNSGTIIIWLEGMEASISYEF